MDLAVALEDEIQLVLSLVRVRRVLLTRLERVQPGKQKITLHDGALTHFVRCEPGETGNSFYEHARQFIKTLWAYGKIGLVAAHIEAIETEEDLDLIHRAVDFARKKVLKG